MFVQTHGLHAELMGGTYQLTMKMPLEMLYSLSKEALQGANDEQKPTLLLQSVLLGDPHTKF